MALPMLLPYDQILMPLHYIVLLNVPPLNSWYNMTNSVRVGPIEIREGKGLLGYFVSSSVTLRYLPVLLPSPVLNDSNNGASVIYLGDYSTVNSLYSELVSSEVLSILDFPRKD